MAVPAVTPLTRPALSTVAIASSSEVHAFEAAGVPLPVNCVDDPAQTVVVPVITGLGFTVTTAVPWQPLTSV